MERGKRGVALARGLGQHVTEKRAIGWHGAFDGERRRLCAGARTILHIALCGTDGISERRFILAIDQRAERAIVKQGRHAGAASGGDDRKAACQRFDYHARLPFIAG